MSVEGQVGVVCQWRASMVLCLGLIVVGLADLMLLIIGG